MECTTVDNGGDDDRIIELTQEMMKEVAVQCLPILYGHRKLIDEFQKKWPGGHREIYPDDIADLLLLIQVLERIKKRGGNSGRQSES